jgi:hypothetical protein
MAARSLAGVTLPAWRVWLPMLSAALVVAALCYFGAPLYIENDDPGLAMVGAGFGEAVHPEPHLIFSHYGYGLILGTLSRLVGPYAHGWFTIFAIWFSLVLVIRASLRAADLKVCLTILVVCLGCIYLATLLSAEFTTTAAVLFGAAIAEWLSSSYREPKWPYLGTAVLLVALVLSYLIRPESYLMGFIIVLPMLAVLCWRSQVKQRARLLAISLVIIAIAGFETDNLAYSNSSDWRDIPEYNDLRAQFTDYGRVPWLPQAPEYRQLGWSYNDYAMFTQWYTRNPIYSIENLGDKTRRTDSAVDCSESSYQLVRLSFRLLALAANFILPGRNLRTAGTKAEIPRHSPVSWPIRCHNGSGFNWKRASALGLVGSLYHYAIGPFRSLRRGLSEGAVNVSKVWGCADCTARSRHWPAGLHGPSTRIRPGGCVSGLDQ